MCDRIQAAKDFWTEIQALRKRIRELEMKVKALVLETSSEGKRK